MKRTFIVLACAGFVLATMAGDSGAQVLPVPTPRGSLPDYPDNPEASRPGNGGYMASFPGYKPRPKDTKVYPPVISGAKMVNGRVRFTFTGSSTTTLRYIIGWSRPGMSEVMDMRWTGPRHETMQVVEDYTINEKPLPNTVYYFRVQAEGKNKIYGRYPLTNFVGLSFRTPAGPSLGDKIKLGEKHGPSTTKSKADPFGVSLVETSVRLKPLPPIGAKLTTSPYSLVTPVQPLSVFQKTLAQPAPLLRVSPTTARKVK